MRAYYVPGTDLNAGKMAENKIDKNPTLVELTFSRGRKSVSNERKLDK